MAKQANVDQVVNIILSAGNEFGSWALHYDSARFNVTALIVAIVAAGAGFAINSRRDDIRIGGLIAVGIVGLVLTGLSGEYYRLYLENTEMQDKMRQFATRYVTGEKKPESFSRCKLEEKILQARLETFSYSMDEYKGDKLNDCEQRKYYKEQYDKLGSLFSWAVFCRVIGSSWTLLCLIYALGIPGACLAFRVKRAEADTGKTPI